MSAKLSVAFPPIRDLFVVKSACLLLGNRKWDRNGRMGRKAVVCSSPGEWPLWADCVEEVVGWTIVRALS
jgi:hypothetical protein